MVHLATRYILAALVLAMSSLMACAEGWHMRGHFFDDGTYTYPCYHAIPDATCEMCAKNCPHWSPSKVMRNVEGPLGSRRDPYATGSFRVDIGRIAPVVQRLGRPLPAANFSQEAEAEAMPGLRGRHSFGPCFQSVLYEASIEEAYYLQGIGFFQMGQLGQAQKAFAEASRALPNSPVVQYNLGVVCANMGCWDKAEQAFQKAVRLNPNFAAARSGLEHIQLHRRLVPVVAQVAWRSAPGVWSDSHEPGD
jgi:hypothetical protein